MQNLTPEQLAAELDKEPPMVNEDLQKAVMRTTMEALSACYHAGLEDVPELSAAYLWLRNQLN